MPLLRIIFAVLIGFSLAVTPVAAAMAKPMTAMAHCDKKGMGAQDGGNCCCDKAHACPAGDCALKCFKTTCLLPAAIKTLDVVRQSFERSNAERATLVAWPPPAPPPRA